MNSTFRMLISTVTLMCSLGCFHYAVLSGNLSFWETVFRSFISTFQSFSMDLDYDSFISGTRNLASALFEKCAFLIPVTVAYAYILGYLAPIISGAVLLEIITSLFPSLKLRLVSLLYWKDVCYFSKLNDRSLALAKSLAKEDEKALTRRIIVFTDAYSDEEEKIESERLYTAKSIGAILLKEDIKHVHIRKKVSDNFFFIKHLHLGSSGSNHFFLADDKEVNNLRNLTALADDTRYQCLKKAFVYLFLQDDIHELAEREIYDALETKFSEEKEQRTTASGKTDSMLKKLLPVIKPIKCYRNMANNLFFELPLYEPLVGKSEKGKYKLNVTVVGTGLIGTEIFLSAYWFGQMHNTDLYINLVSEETEADFKKRIDYINSDIFKTGLPVNDVSESDLLRVYPDEKTFAEPYFQYRYYETDLKKDNLYEKLSEKRKNDEFRLLDSDYIVVAVGSDEENLEIANRIKQSLTVHHLTFREKKTIIAFVVYDSDLCNVLRQNEYRNEKDGVASGVYMYPFGSLDEIYSCRNIFMRESENNARATQRNYRSMTCDSEMVNEKDTLEALRGRRDGDYDYWANRARAMHIKYKVFASGYLNKSIFDEGHAEAFEQAWRSYENAVKEYNADDEMQKLLAWTEHRRWNAFTRTMGFRCPTEGELDSYFSQTGNHKNLTLKLHPCLVESDKTAMNRDAYNDTPKDMLDLATVKISSLKGLKPNYKEYDYPWYDFHKGEG